jgi:ribosomal protein S18 acetylase RimI-like enzyme
LRFVWALTSIGRSYNLEGLVEFQDIEYTHSPVEIEEMGRLLTDNYAGKRKPFNWRLAAFENWVFASRYLEPLEYFTRRCHLWRNEQGSLAAFVILGANFVHVQIGDAYRSHETEIFEWAERNSFGDERELGTMVYDWDLERQKLLADRGYQNRGAIEDVRIYDLSKDIPQPHLPAGFRFSTLAEVKDYEAFLVLVNQVWGVSLNEAWFRGKNSAPSYSLDRKLLVISPEGRQAAYSLVWLYPENETAEIDPIGTHPDFRRRGLSRALVLESFRRMKENGIRYAYIASETQDPIVSHLYASLQPMEFYQGYHWGKSLV